MKSVSLIPVRRGRAFTIPELMVAMTIFSFVTIGIIFAHLYGLTMFHITETSLTATTAARQGVADQPGAVGNLLPRTRGDHSVDRREGMTRGGAA